MKLRLLALPLMGFFANTLNAQKYDPVDGGFETRERKIQAQTNPRLQQKNLEEWMELNLGYAPAGGLIQHTGGYSYTWLQGFPVVWKGPNEGKRIIKSNVPKDIKPLKPYPASKCVCIFNHEVGNQEYLDFVTDVFLAKMRVLNPQLTFMDKRGNFTDSFLNSLTRHFLKPGVLVTKLNTGTTLGSVLIQQVKDSITQKEHLLHELLDLSKITYNGVRIFPYSSGWSVNLTLHSWGDPMALYYLCHKAYSSYPICNLRQSQAMAYCQWLSAQLTALSGKEIVVSLPTEMEWIQAASYESEDSKSSYKPSTSDPYWRNSKGVYIANLVGYSTPEQLRKYQDQLNRKKMLEGDSSGGNGDSISPEIIGTYLLDYTGARSGYPMPVYSYWPTDASCYNIFGNVAEMTSTTEGEMMVVKGGSFMDIGEVLLPGSRAFVYIEEAMPMVGFRPVFKMR
ncbi:MAG: formylglycine-generating enzyme family protein [Bacteroidia bacterium]|nr:formylglycine-generating enzyme family protein [Bacteroidia bacterium]